MLFDFRTFAGESFDGVSQTVGALLRSMDALEVEASLVCPLKPVSYNLNDANSALAAGLRAHPDRLFGAARIDPWQPSAAGSLRRAVEDLSLRALYLNPWEEHFRADLERLDPLMDLARIYSLPVLVATGYPWLSEALQVCELARRWPSVPVVMTNGGQINISGLGQADASLAMQKATNLHIDTAGVYRQDFIEETIQAFGRTRVLYASGSPYFDPRYEVRRVMLAKVAEEDRLAIQAENAKRLLRIKPQ
jgi:predicted TIM-barrel fold metal-dependent hydrolase